MSPDQGFSLVPTDATLGVYDATYVLTGAYTYECTAIDARGNTDMEEITVNVAFEHCKFNIASSNLHFNSLSNSRYSHFITAVGKQYSEHFRLLDLYLCC